MAANRRIRLQLAIGFVAILAIASAVIWLRNWRIQSRSQRLAEWDVLFQTDDAGEVTQINYWPRGLATEEFAALQEYSRLTLINLDGVPATDDDVAVLKRIPALETLLLSGSRVTDDCIDTLADFPSLQRVNLAGTAVTRTGVLRLKQQSPDLQIDYNALEINGLGHLVAYQGHGDLNDQLELTALDLKDLDITDDDLRPVANCPKLHMVNLSGTKVTDVGLQHLRLLKNVHELWLTGTVVSDDGLKEIAKLHSLKKLSLAETRISDEGIAELAKLKNLQVLHLGSTSISDDGLRRLKVLSQLKELHVSKSAVTKAGTEELSKTNPVLRVFGASEPEKPIREIESRVLG